MVAQNLEDSDKRVRFLKKRRPPLGEAFLKLRNLDEVTDYELTHVLRDEIVMATNNRKIELRQFRLQFKKHCETIF